MTWLRLSKLWQLLWLDFDLICSMKWPDLVDWIDYWHEKVSHLQPSLIIAMKNSVKHDWSRIAFALLCWSKISQAGMIPQGCSQLWDAQEYISWNNKAWCCIFFSSFSGKWKHCYIEGESLKLNVGHWRTAWKCGRWTLDSCFTTASISNSLTIQAGLQLLIISSQQYSKLFHVDI